MITAAVITAAFFINNITPFKNAANDSLQMPRQYKQIHFVLGKMNCLCFLWYVNIVHVAIVYDQFSYLIRLNARAA